MLRLWLSTPLQLRACTYMQSIIVATSRGGQVQQPSRCNATMPRLALACACSACTCAAAKADMQQLEQLQYCDTLMHLPAPSCLPVASCSNMQ